MPAAFMFSLDRVSLCDVAIASLELSVDQAGLKLRVLPASTVLGVSTIFAFLRGSL